MSNQDKVKVTLYRASGFPVRPGDRELYLEELNKEMDNLENMLGKCTKDNAEQYQEIMEQIHRKLSLDYPNRIQTTFPTSTKAMEDLCDKYGSVAFCKEEDELVAYVLDA